MTKVLCIGSACQDIFFPTEEGKIIDTPEDLLSQRKIAFELGAKYKISERFESLGGCAANVAVGLQRLGIDAEIFSAIGGDYIGEWIKKELEKNVVDTKNLSKKEKLKSDLSSIVVDEKSGDRVIFANKKMVSDEINEQAVDEADEIFLGDLNGDWVKMIEEILKLSGEKEKKVIYNPREAHIKENPKKVGEIIGRCDTVFLNKDEALEIISSAEDDDQDKLNDGIYLIKKIMKLGVKKAVITDGKRGAWVADGREILMAPGLDVQVVDSTGAGDAFLSGFLAAKKKGKNLEECLQWGIANSASVVEHYGGIEGLLSEDEISKRAE